MWAVVVFGAITAAQAQDTSAQPGSMSVTWSEIANTAENTLVNGTATDAQLEATRVTLSALRERALEIQDRDGPRVAELEDQLSALGPVPEDGEEPEAIATQRATLNASLDELRTPVVEADVAYRRADSLIGQIDSELRDRRAKKLTTLGPTPLNPANWSLASDHLSALYRDLAAGLSARLDSAGNRSAYLGRLPFVAVLLLGAAGLWFVVMPRVVAAATQAAKGQKEPRRFVYIGYGRNLARLLLAGLAAYFVVLAIGELSPGGLPAGFVSDALPNAALAAVAAYFGAHGLFGDPVEDFALIDRGATGNRRARRLFEGLGVVLAVSILIDGLTSGAPFTDGSRAVLFFPLCLVGVFLMRPLVTLLRADSPQSTEAGLRPDSAAMVLLRWIARLASIAAFVAPILAAIGYLNLAKFLFVPTILTFIVIGFLMVGFVIITESLEHWIVGDGELDTLQSRGAFRLLPVLIGFLILAAGVPLVALIWGARMADLQEIWVWLREGVPIGDARFSITELLTFILVFAIGYAITRSVQAAVRSSVLPRTDMDIGAKNAVLAGLGYVGIFLAALVAITSTGLNLSNLAIVAGALSVGIGFGLQAIVSNFVSGIILLIERPIKEGDWIEVAGFAGYVRQISVRSTLIDTFDKSTVIVPNAELIAGTVLNRTHSNLTGRVVVPIGVAYGSDVREVEALLKGIAQSHEQVLQFPEPSVVFRGFGADSMDFEIRAQIRDVNNKLSVSSDMNFAIAERLAEAGIEIPFAQREVTIKNMDELSAVLGRGSK